MLRRGAMFERRLPRVLTTLQRCYKSRLTRAVLLARESTYERDELRYYRALIRVMS